MSIAETLKAIVGAKKKDPDEDHPPLTSEQVETCKQILEAAIRAEFPEMSFEDDDIGQMPRQAMTSILSIPRGMAGKQAALVEKYLATEEGREKLGRAAIDPFKARLRLRLGKAQATIACINDALGDPPVNPEVDIYFGGNPEWELPEDAPTLWERLRTDDESV